MRLLFESGFDNIKDQVFSERIKEAEQQSVPKLDKSRYKVAARTRKEADLTLKKAGFEYVTDDYLIHRANADFWEVKATDDGVEVQKLVDEDIFNG